MKIAVRYASLVPLYLVILAAFIMIGMGGSRVITVIAENAPVVNRNCVVIDAGHGGIDGGAVSCTGAYESHINLEIALILDDLMHLLGIDTHMIRTTDCSVYTKGETIAAKKVSDLKERVRIVNSRDAALLISIHQNHFTDDRYSGAQVFYANSKEGEQLAEKLQTALVKTLNPSSKRKCKKAEGVYLMQHIQCPGVLVECGFLSNPEEEAELRSNRYQKKLCCVLASVVSQYLQSTPTA